ncbi:MAG: hypothetical protein IJ325_10815 [Clostridia bacterium]|nr:hypothetical protein [Clostridia bacterium]
MREKYIDLMEKILSAYTVEHIIRYFDDVKRDGLTEHGFPRLTSDIGILIGHGRRTELKDLFCEMMDFCCAAIPTVKAANDFSVREVICCIAVLEKNRIFDAEKINGWKECLKTIDPQKCYTSFAVKPDDIVHNWALFTAVSEYFRYRMGLSESPAFAELQVAAQMKWLDENGMYKDSPYADPIRCPMVYDQVPRGLFSCLLFAGYTGPYAKEIDDYLRKAGLCTLVMQSVTGELPFGGRSNQFLHNEAWMAAICEFEAVRYHKEGNHALAGKFKAAVHRAIENTEYWLNKTPISHVKNRFPFQEHFGCEDYAYFDKYMITAASFYYAAYMFCDDSIKAAAYDDSPAIWSTSEYFHKVFARAGGYSLEFDTNADPHYDAKGLGRIHKYGAPSPICLSLPCPAAHPNYKIKGVEPTSMSLCPGIKQDGEWKFAADPEWVHEMTDSETGADYVSLTMNCRLEDRSVSTKYRVDASGVCAAVKGSGEIAYMLPAFSFDGETEPEIAAEEHCLTVTYEGWQCRYTTNGRITDTGKTTANRNGYYRIFYASGENALDVKVEIVKK